MEIYIDGASVDTDSRTNVHISLCVASVTEFDKAKVGYCKTIIVPMTPGNRAVMGDSEEINSV